MYNNIEDFNIGENVCFIGNERRGWRQSAIMHYGKVAGFDKKFVVIQFGDGTTKRKMPHTLTKII